MRSAADRARDVRRLVEAARAVVRDRARWAAEIAASSGLSPEGVERAFLRHVEVDASDDAIAALVARAGDAPEVHVVLSANVFVAPLRAMAIARAASGRVRVRPSRRDPTFARALVDGARDPAIAIADFDVANVDRGEIHVYGRDETIADVRRRARVKVRGHGAGMGVALVSRDARVDDAARALAEDVVAFDQRGCLSPRVAIVLGDARAFADALSAALADEERTVPRGVLSEDEAAEAARWCGSVAFAGELARGRAHAVAIAPASAIPPPGRHVLVVPAADEAAAAAIVAPLARHVVAVGSDDAALAARVAPPHARRSALGDMQRPPLDGPVDLRPEWR